MSVVVVVVRPWRSVFRTNRSRRNCEKLPRIDDIGYMCTLVDCLRKYDEAKELVWNKEYLLSDSDDICGTKDIRRRSSICEICQGFIRLSKGNFDLFNLASRLSDVILYRNHVNLEACFKRGATY